MSEIGSAFQFVYCRPRLLLLYRFQQLAHLIRVIPQIVLPLVLASNKSVTSSNNDFSSRFTKAALSPDVSKFFCPSSSLRSTTRTWLIEAIIIVYVRLLILLNQFKID